jgi:hypothetical protein
MAREIDGLFDIGSFEEERDHQGSVSDADSGHDVRTALFGRAVSRALGGATTSSVASFLREPGAVVFFNHRRGKRVYRIVRIPESVAQRVHRRMRRDEARA